MQDFFDVLSACPLFEGIAGEELTAMMGCLGGKKEKIPKGEPVFLEGDPAWFVGVVLSGAVQVVRDDYYGNRSVMTVAEPGDMFAEAFSCAGMEKLPASAIALTDSQVMYMDCARVLHLCGNACPFHNRLVSNLLRALARKNLALSRKIQIMSHKTTRDKIMAYLLEQAKMRQSSQFTIPYDRQALADHLGVERSAMSAEISKLKKMGLIDTNGSWFHILQEKDQPSR